MSPHRRRAAPAAPSLAEWVAKARSSWAVLAQGAAWLLGLAGGFLLAPPVTHSGVADNTWLRFGQFFVAVALGLVVFAALKWRQRRHATRWAVVAGATLVLAAVMFFLYQYLLYSWTAEYDRQLVITGVEYTEHGKAVVGQNPKLTPKDLLWDHGGDPEAIWTLRSLNPRRLTLAGVYVSILPLVTLAVIAVVQALRCLGVVAGSGSGGQRASARTEGATT